MVGLFLCLKHQKSSQIINGFLTLIPASNRPVQPHNRGNRPINLLCGLLLVRLDVSRRIRPDIDIVHYPPKDRMPAMCQLLLQRQLHQFLPGNPKGISGFFPKKVKSQQLNLFEHFKLADGEAFVS